jgi:hypothetical protein
MILSLPVHLFPFISASRSSASARDETSDYFFRRHTAYDSICAELTSLNCLRSDWRLTDSPVLGVDCSNAYKFHGASLGDAGARSSCERHLVRRRSCAGVGAKPWVFRAYGRKRASHAEFGRSRQRGALNAGCAKNVMTTIWVIRKNFGKHTVERTVGVSRKLTGINRRHVWIL